MQRLVFIPDGATVLSGDIVSISDSPLTDYVIGSPDGIGIPEVTLTEATSPAIDGSEIQSVRYGARTINDTVHINGSSRRDMYEKRKRLMSLLSPARGEGMLYYYNNAGAWRIRALPRIVEPQGRIGNFSKCRISFYCANPYWQELKPVKLSVFASKDAGFLMGSYVDERGMFFAAPDKMSVVYNASSEYVPVNIVIHGPFNTVNGFATIKNETTGKYITLSQSISSDDTLTISTKPGNITVTLKHDGEDGDGFTYIYPDSDLSFDLAPGQNNIIIDCNADDVTSEISLEYIRRYIGL